MHCLTMLGTRSHSPGGPPPPLSLSSSTPESLPVRAPPFDDNDSFEPPCNNFISPKCVASVLHQRLVESDHSENMKNSLNVSFSSVIYIYIGYREANASDNKRFHALCAKFKDTETRRTTFRIFKAEFKQWIDPLIMSDDNCLAFSMDDQDRRWSIWFDGKVLEI